MGTQALSERSCCGQFIFGHDCYKNHRTIWRRWDFDSKKTQRKLSPHQRQTVSPTTTIYIYIYDFVLVPARRARHLFHSMLQLIIVHNFPNRMGQNVCLARKPPKHSRMQSERLLLNSCCSVGQHFVSRLTYINFHFWTEFIQSHPSYTTNRLLTIAKHTRLSQDILCVSASFLFSFLFFLASSLPTSERTKKKKKSEEKSREKKSKASLSLWSTWTRVCKWVIYRWRKRKEEKCYEKLAANSVGVNERFFVKRKCERTKTK